MDATVPISSQQTTLTKRRSAIEPTQAEVKMADRSEPSSEGRKLKQKGPEESGVKFDDLPWLPFKKILSYLSLEELIKARRVSKGWRQMIDSFRPKSLCFSNRPSNFVSPKSHWVSGTFAQNFISSTRFDPFFQTFGQSILATLKHLRLCELYLNAENTLASLVQILNSFDQLEELGLFNVHHDEPVFWSKHDGDLQLRLSLPMLKSVQLEKVRPTEKLTLDAPKLQNVKVAKCFDLKMKLIHSESVEKLFIDRLDQMEVKNLKNLKYLYCNENLRIDSTLLSTLDSLNEIHLGDRGDVVNIFEQKPRYGHSNLKIFLRGCLLNDPNDPAIDFLQLRSKRGLSYLAEHRSRLAREIPFEFGFDYSPIEDVAPGQEIEFLNRFTDLQSISVNELVRDIDRFLELLKNLNKIAELKFECAQPQALFDRLPDHCGIQSLTIKCAPADFDFLFKLKWSLLKLDFEFPIDIELISKVLEELPFISFFRFGYLDKFFVITIDPSKDLSVLFFSIEDGMVKVEKSATFFDVNAAIQWISKSGTTESEDEE